MRDAALEHEVRVLQPAAEPVHERGSRRPPGTRGSRTRARARCTRRSSRSGRRRVDHEAQLSRRGRAVCCRCRTVARWRRVRPRCVRDTCLVLSSSRQVSEQVADRARARRARSRAQARRARARRARRNRAHRPGPLRHPEPPATRRRGGSGGRLGGSGRRPPGARPRARARGTPGVEVWRTRLRPAGGRSRSRSRAPRMRRGRPSPPPAARHASRPGARRRRDGEAASPPLRVLSGTGAVDPDRRPRLAAGAGAAACGGARASLRGGLGAARWRPDLPARRRGVCAPGGGAGERERRPTRAPEERAPAGVPPPVVA